MTFAGRAPRPLLLALLVVACAAHLAGGRELLAKKPKQYAPNLYEAIIKAKLYTLKAAVDAAGLARQLAKPDLQITLMAPSEEAWQRYFTDCRQGVPEYWNAAKFCSLEQLLAPANRLKLQQLLKYHMVQGPQLVTLEEGNAFWRVGLKFVQVKTLQSLAILQLRWWHMLDERGGFEAHGTGRDALMLEAASNRAAGKSLLHTVDNVLTSFPSPF